MLILPSVSVDVLLSNYCHQMILFKNMLKFWRLLNVLSVRYVMICNFRYFQWKLILFLTCSKLLIVTVSNDSKTLIIWYSNVGVVFYLNVICILHGVNVAQIKSQLITRIWRLKLSGCRKQLLLKNTFMQVNLFQMNLYNIDLTHFSPMFLFYNPWKRQKTFVFRGYRNVTLD